MFAQTLLNEANKEFTTYFYNWAVLSQWFSHSKFSLFGWRTMVRAKGPKSQQGEGGGSHRSHNLQRKIIGPAFLGGGNSNIFGNSPRSLEKWSNLTIYNIFQGGWKHQPVYFRYTVFFLTYMWSCLRQCHVKVLLPVAQPVSGTVS